MSDIPEGWQLVPIEPTREMLAATKEAFAEVNGIIAFSAARGSHPGGLKNPNCLTDAWRAMLAASPAPPVVGGDSSVARTPAASLSSRNDQTGPQSEKEIPE